MIDNDEVPCFLNLAVQYKQYRNYLIMKNRIIKRVLENDENKV